MQSRQIAGLHVVIEHKNIKNLHLTVCPPEGRIRIAAPIHISEDAITLAVLTKLKWLKRQQQRFQEQPRQAERTYCSGEAIYVFGRKYKLQLKEASQYKLEFNGKSKITLHARRNSLPANKQAYVETEFKKMLCTELEKCITKWSDILQLPTSNLSWEVRKMKNKWVSVRPSTKCISFNLELIRVNHLSIEYVVLSSLLNLIYETNNPLFQDRLDTLMPKWKLHHQELNASTLSLQQWI